MTHTFICLFRTLGYTSKDFFWQLGFFTWLQSECLRHWCRKSRKFKDVGSTRWKMTMPRSLDAEGRWLGPDKLLQYTPSMRCKLTHATDSGGCQQAGVGKENLPHLLLPGRGYGQSQPQRADVWHILFSDLFVQYKWIDAYLLMVSLFLQN